MAIITLIQEFEMTNEMWSCVKKTYDNLNSEKVEQVSGLHWLAAATYCDNLANVEAF